VSQVAVPDHAETSTEPVGTAVPTGRAGVTRLPGDTESQSPLD